MNHVKEGQQIWAARGRKVELPTFPAAFAKFTSSLTATDSEIRIPTGVRAVDYEIELAIVIGRRASSVAEADALSFVAGYTICNDIGARELQRLEMESQIGITLSKNFPTFGPMGPWMVTADEIADPQALTMELRVNGERRQHASTSDMIFTVRQIVAYWSRIGLQPGDIISTGTPSGIALAMPEPEKYYLKPGDVIEAEIDGIGRLVNRVVGAPVARD
jgi:2-keto-4-pentenoate hydratase/2-oxohepta-3-ene-1,7-dioic acid hydratase in catechol pathway